MNDTLGTESENDQELFNNMRDSKSKPKSGQKMRASTFKSSNNKNSNEYSSKDDRRTNVQKKYSYDLEKEDQDDKSDLKSSIFEEERIAFNNYIMGLFK